MRSLLFAVAMLLIFSACEHAGPLEVDPDVATFTSVQANVFDTSCAVSGCHVGTNPPPFGGGLNLEEGQAYAALVGVMSTEVSGILRVAPGDPLNSYLFQKIIDDPSIAGQRMPLGRERLSEDQIDLVRRWIAEGAMDN